MTDSDFLKPARADWSDFAEIGYERLAGILQEAHDQAARGKGKARHANGKPFPRQPIMEIARMVGPGYPLGQIMKKAQEARSMAVRGEHDAARAELLGIINYAAAAVLLIEERGASQPASGKVPVSFFNPTPVKL